MAGPKLSGPLILLMGMGIAGCRGTPPPVTRTEAPAAVKIPEAPPQAPAPSNPATPPAPTQEKPARANAAVVVDPGVEGDGTPASLVEAARAEKERRSRSGQSSVVINDKNLPKYASKGQITISKEKNGKKGSAKVAAPEKTPAPGTVKDEQYWRDRARDIRERWHQTDEDVKKLEQKSTELRQKFYLENDLFVRDSQIKPEWDRTLDRLRMAREEEEGIKKELDAFLEEGRGAGAEPAWLNEGEETEPAQADSGRPTPRKKEVGPPARSIEPPVFRDNRDKRRDNNRDNGDDGGRRGRPQPGDDDGHGGAG